MRGKLAAVIFLTALLLLSPFVAGAESVFQIGRDIVVDEDQVVDNVVSLNSQITVNGLVENNVVAVAGSVVLTNRAVVRGNVIVVGGVVARGSGSLVYGDLTEINSSTLSEAVNSVLRGETEGWSLIVNIISLCFLAIILIVTLVLTLLIPRSLAGVTNAIAASPVKAFLWGFLATLLIVPFFMLLAFSIIGIFLIPLAFTALLLAAIIGFVAFGVILGNLILAKIFPGYRKSLIKEAFLGVSVLWLVGWIPFYIGMVIKVLAVTFGLGGIILALSRRKSVR